MDREFYARTYDVSVSDWPGELDFYLRMASQAAGEVLELAVGTGRIAIRLAQTGIAVTGLDRSPEMLDFGRAKSVELSNMRWVEADMRNFELGVRFGLVLVPGHSFQNLLTTDDQIACLRQVEKHLLPGGLFVVHLDHQDIEWLGAISGTRLRLGSPPLLARLDAGLARWGSGGEAAPVPSTATTSTLASARNAEPVEGVESPAVG